MNTEAFWVKEWSRRISANGDVEHNIDKAKKIMGNLKGRNYFYPHNILDIGCGPAFHAIQILQDAPEYSSRWYGIDLAPIAVSFFKDHGLNGECGSVYDLQDDKKYGVFLLLDTLEHITDRERLAGKIKSLAEGRYVIFGNIPLYIDKVNGEAGMENPMDIGILKAFMESAGCAKFDHLVYGIYGWPYMLFEGEGKL